ncbi:hypothetical protein DFH09DRAFT_1070280 [Mycena vulgaris]|nr:hypothetical protein DFH09DRAFT_1070280 [Mycena vulgaris]
MASAEDCNLSQTSIAAGLYHAKKIVFGAEYWVENLGLPTVPVFTGAVNGSPSRPVVRVADEICTGRQRQRAAVDGRLRFGSHVNERGGCSTSFNSSASLEFGENDPQESSSDAIFRTPWHRTANSRLTAAFLPSRVEGRTRRGIAD